MIRSARVNQNSQVAHLLDMVQWYSDSGIQTGRIKSFARRGGNTYLILDDDREVSAWYVQLATLVRITPHSTHRLQGDLVAGQRVIAAGTTVLITTWYANTVAIVVDHELPGVTVPIRDLVAALRPGLDPRLVNWSLGGA